MIEILLNKESHMTSNKGIRVLPMMTAAFLLLLFVASTAAVGLEYCSCRQVRVNYTGYKVFSVTPLTAQHNEILQQLLPDNALDFWQAPTVQLTVVQVMVPPRRVRGFTQLLERNSMRFQVPTEDVQTRIDRLNIRAPSVFQYDQFNTFDLIQSELHVLAADCPSEFSCNVASIGNSCQGRPLNVLTISTGRNTGRSLWVDSLIHAREWLAGATTMKIFDRLIREYGSNAEAASIVNRYDHIYFLAVVNPDGYVYSWTVDRLWRKNRRLGDCDGNINDFIGTPCTGEDEKPGVDLNRNFDSNWNGVVNEDYDMEDPCSIVYQGPQPASELETQAVQNFLSSKTGVEVYLSFHSYGRFYLYPYGDCEIDLPNESDLASIVEKAAEATGAVYNTNWKGWRACDLYNTSGTSRDWARQSGIPFSFTVEVRGAAVIDEAEDGFLAAPEDIELSFNEVWAGLVAIFSNIPLGVQSP